jgi:hypothetical protein
MPLYYRHCLRRGICGAFIEPGKRCGQAKSFAVAQTLLLSAFAWLG